MGFIYKITNNINNKIYIGMTTTTIEQRFQQHIRTKTTLLGKAINKYGKENFLIEVLEELDNQQLFEKEIYFINYFNSIMPYGYNMTLGGENPPKTFGENNIHSSLTNDNFDKIIKLLINTVITYKEIANQFNVHISTIERINIGKIRFNKNIIYPIRKFSKYEQIALSIIDDLINTKMTNKQIAEKYMVGIDIPSRINTGKRYLYLHNYNIPIREIK